MKGKKGFAQVIAGFLSSQFWLGVALLVVAALIVKFLTGEEVWSNITDWIGLT